MSDLYPSGCTTYYVCLNCLPSAITSSCGNVFFRFYVCMLQVMLEYEIVRPLKQNCGISFEERAAAHHESQ